jgi:hypothetical protein
MRTTEIGRPNTLQPNDGHGIVRVKFQIHFRELNEGKLSFLRTAIAGLIVFIAAMHSAAAMDFAFRGNRTVHASGPIEHGDAARFAALPKFDTLELDSPGGYVGEALNIAANIDARGGIRTTVPPGASCASACAMALFVSGETRIVYMGGRLGIHSCSSSDGSQAEECNERMAANATAHGVPWGVIQGFGSGTRPSDMLWFSAEESECWGLIKWSAADSSNNGIACFKKNLLSMQKAAPEEVTRANADDVVCRLNTPTSQIFVSNGMQDQGFTDGYRAACERVAADPKTPKYAAIDIILWLTLSDPNIRNLKPGTMMLRILNNDSRQTANCWKCLTIVGMSEADHGLTKDALVPLEGAVKIVQRETGSVPRWLTSRIELIAADAARPIR